MSEKLSQPSEAVRAIPTNEKTPLLPDTIRATNIKPSSDTVEVYRLPEVSLLVPTRVKILKTLLGGKALTAREIKRASGISIQNTIYHCGILMNFGLVERELFEKPQLNGKKGQVYVYFLTKKGADVIEYWER